METLPFISPGSGTEALQLLRRCSSAGSIKISAGQGTLPTLLNGGRRRSKPSVVQFLEEDDVRLRASVLRTLESRPRTVDPNDVENMKAQKMIAERLLDARPEVRVDALLACGLTTSRDRNGAYRVGTIVEHLSDKDSNVRSAASKALTSVLASGQAKDVGEVMKHLKHSDANVRSSILKCFRTPHCTRLPLERNPEVLKSITNMLMDKDADVRAAAVCAFGALAFRGKSFGVQAIMTCLSDKSSQVRASALRALGKLAEKGDAKATTAISKNTYDDDAEVQTAALQALGTVAEKGNTAARDIILEHLEDGNPQVRDAAMRALSKVAKPGDLKVQEAIQQRIDDDASPVRFSAKYLMVYHTSKN